MINNNTEKSEILNLQIYQYWKKIEDSIKILIHTGAEMFLYKDFGS